MANDPQIRTRDIARLVLISPSQTVLLIKHEHQKPIDPQRPDLLSFWVPPGGGVIEKETFEDAALRELHEETGVTVDGMPLWVWTRDGNPIYYGDELVRVHERYFLLRVPEELELGPLSDEIVKAKWWPIAEIEQSNEMFLPFGFRDLMPPLLQSTSLPDSYPLIIE